MLKIERITNGEIVLTVTGQLGTDNLSELLALIVQDPFGRSIALDLKNLVLVDRNAIHLLKECEARGILLRNCPPYIRVWISSKEDEP